MAVRTIFAVIVSIFGINLTNAQDALPEGEGRDIVEHVCSLCHGLVQVTNARKTSEQWAYLVTQMKNQGAPIEEYEVEKIVRYLSEHFGQ